MSGTEVPRAEIINEPWRPKDGPGPRGVPDCYYRSRVLNSTHNYASFVNRLRRSEQKLATGDAQALRQLCDYQFSEFCVRSDRRNCINAVARKVDLCMESYQDDLNKKRARLRALLRAEEESCARAFVAQAQAGGELAARARSERLVALREKRAREHLDKYKETPISKCAEMTGLVFAARAREAKACQLGQMGERAARRQSDAELERMWHEVAMREDEALAARSEYDAMERYRRDMECKAHGDMQVAQKKLSEQKERQRLKEETIRMRKQFDEEEKKAEQEEAMLEKKRRVVGRELTETLKEIEKAAAKQKEAERLIQNTFDSLKDQSNAQIQQQIELRNRKAREVVQCNRHLVELKGGMQRLEREREDATEATRLRLRESQDEERCAYQRKRDAINKEAPGSAARQAEARRLPAEIGASARDESTLAAAEHAHLLRMDALQAGTDADKRRDHQRHLREQIAYQRLLQKRAQREEVEIIEKYKRAEKEYKEEVAEMLRRPSFCDKTHAFRNQINKGLALPKDCPCGSFPSKDFCEKSN